MVYFVLNGVWVADSCLGVVRLGGSYCFAIKLVMCVVFFMNIFTVFLVWGRGGSINSADFVVKKARGVWKGAVSGVVSFFMVLSGLPVGDFCFSYSVCRGSFGGIFSC